MQTFLPYSDFKQTAKCLDYRRLGKQRVEAFQILRIIERTSKLNSNGKVAWENHPIVKMWKGYSFALKEYFNVILTEWINRGYKNNMQYYDLPTKFSYPLWLGNKDFHDSHKSNLLRKDFNFYSKYLWNVQNDLEYMWMI